MDLFELDTLSTRLEGFMAKKGFTRLTRQRRVILLLALFRLKYLHHKVNPSRAQVTNYIEIYHLMMIRDGEREKVSTGEEGWANSVAWTRNDLKDLGLLNAPDRDVWALSRLGEKSLFGWMEEVEHWLKSYPPSTMIRLLAEVLGEDIIFTEDTFTKAHEAYEVFCEKFPEERRERKEPPSLVELSNLFRVSGDMGDHIDLEI